MDFEVEMAKKLRKNYEEVVKRGKEFGKEKMPCRSEGDVVASVLCDTCAALRVLQCR
jgi:hypothetical protein